MDSFVYLLKSEYSVDKVCETEYGNGFLPVSHCTAIRGVYHDRKEADKAMKTLFSKDKKSILFDDEGDAMTIAEERIHCCRSESCALLVFKNDSGSKRKVIDTSVCIARLNEECYI